MIRGDQERLSHAIENLLTNAIKYSKDKDKIIVELIPGYKNVKVSVIDFGIGIDNDHLSKFLTGFTEFRVKKKKPFQEWVLAYIFQNKLSKKHGGKISVESIKNKETKFNFQIPFLIKLIK